MRSSHARTTFAAPLFVLALVLALGGCGAVLGIGELDVAATPDGGVDASDGGVAAIAPFCATVDPAPTFCEDFDEGSVFPSTFTAIVEPSPAHIGTDEAYAKSPPSSLFSRVDQGAAAPRAYATKAFTRTASEIEFAFDVLPLTLPAGGRADIADIVIDAGLPTEHTLSISTSATGAFVEEALPGAGGEPKYVDTSLTAFPAPGAWSRIDIVLSLERKTITVKVGTGTVLDAAPLDASWPVSGTAQIDLGMTDATNAQTGPWVVRYDDVVVRLK